MNNRLAIYILSVVAIALGVVSCGRTGISKSVVMADSLSQSDPAAAMAFIDSITARNENLSTDSRMRLGLLRTKAQNSAGVMFTSDSVMRTISLNIMKVKETQMTVCWPIILWAACTAT